METLLILKNFHVYVAQGTDPKSGAQMPDKKVAYSNGMTVEIANLPPGHSADDWVEKGLAKAV